MNINEKTKLYVAGHNGMVGSAVLRRLSREDCEIITIPKIVRAVLHTSQDH